MSEHKLNMHHSMEDITPCPTPPAKHIPVQAHHTRPQHTATQQATPSSPDKSRPPRNPPPQKRPLGKIYQTARAIPPNLPGRASGPRTRHAPTHRHDPTGCEIIKKPKWPPPSHCPFKL